MSLKTWKAEFYPKPPRKRMTKREAIEHSLRKWKGLRGKALQRHKVAISVDAVIDARDLDLVVREQDCLEIDMDSCALCAKYFNEEGYSFLSEEDSSCDKCPLAKLLGTSCDNRGGPYRTWRDTGDPEPMIRALKALLASCGSSGKKNPAAR